MDIRTFKLECLRHGIGAVFQEALLLNRSIAESLRVGKPDATEEDMRRACARALLEDPPILILDEAASALDAATEGKVQAALDEVMRGRTTFVIAHRLATVRNATRILVFEGGRIVEMGTFDELVRLGGRFTALAKAQFMVAGETPEVGRVAGAEG